MGDGRLRRRKAGDRDAVRAARDVVELDLLAEVDRLGIAAVLAANAELDRLPRFASVLTGRFHEQTHAVRVDRLEGVVGQDRT